VLRASVVIPTHDHAETLDLAVGSVLTQTVRELEVLVLGDGVTEGVRLVAQALAASDARVRFLDLPKGEHRGEAHRDRAVRAARSDAVFYLCDDDLLLPDHVGSLLDLLDDHDLVQSLNGYLQADGSFAPYLSDLSSPGFRDVLQHPRRNSISLTGTAHTVAVYDRLAVGWETTPEGHWPDHFQWRKLLALEGMRAATSDQVTALQLPTHQDGRQDWTPAARRAELVRWRDLLTTPAGQADLDRAVRAGLNAAGAELWADRYRRSDVEQELRQQIGDLTRHLQQANGDLTRTTASLAEVSVHLASESQVLAETTATLDAVRETRTWRIHDGLVHHPVVEQLSRRLPGRRP
jgi:hypothetical protein